MEKELADAFREQRELMAAGFTRLEAISDKNREDANKHYLEDARMFARLEAAVGAGHSRLDVHLNEHTEDKRNRVQLWIGVILAALASVGSMVVSIFKVPKS